MEKIQIIDSTTITLFSNIIFKGAGRNPKSGKKEGGIKVHKVIRALEGVASDINFTSAATHDRFMLAPENFERGDLQALDRAYIDYGKFEELTKRGIVYVTKKKSGLAYKVVSDVMFMDQAKGMVMRIQIQIWVTLIANLLLTIMQRSLHGRWSFSNLATTVRITLMYYVDFQNFFENPEKDWQKVLLEAAEPPPQLELEF